jgi:hypothetical protein
LVFTFLDSTYIAEIKHLKMPTREPTIDYIKSNLLTLDEYILQLQEKANPESESGGVKKRNY